MDAERLYRWLSLWKRDADREHGDTIEADEMTDGQSGRKAEAERRKETS